MTSGVSGTRAGVAWLRVPHLIALFSVPLHAHLSPSHSPSPRRRGEGEGQRQKETHPPIGSGDAVVYGAYASRS